MLEVVFSSVLSIASIGTALASGIGGVTISGVEPPAVPYLQAPPAYSLHQTQVAQYSKNVYSVLVNGFTADVSGPNSTGQTLATFNNLGPFGAPPPPAGTAAGEPYAPGANHNDYAAQVMASLRKLAGNGSIFQ
jgi:hypothetical protein